MLINWTPVPVFYRVFYLITINLHIGGMDPFGANRSHVKQPAITKTNLEKAGVANGQKYHIHIVDCPQSIMINIGLEIFLEQRELKIL